MSYNSYPIAIGFGASEIGRISITAVLIKKPIITVIKTLWLLKNGFPLTMTVRTEFLKTYLSVFLFFSYLFTLVT